MPRTNPALTRAEHLEIYAVHHRLLLSTRRPCAPERDAIMQQQSQGDAQARGTYAGHDTAGLYQECKQGSWRGESGIFYRFIATADQWVARIAPAQLPCARRVPVRADSAGPVHAQRNRARTRTQRHVMHREIKVVTPTRAAYREQRHRHAGLPISAFRPARAPRSLAPLTRTRARVPRP